MVVDEKFIIYGEKNSSAHAYAVQNRVKFALISGDVALEPVLFGDFDGNGKITAADARKILRMAAKLE